MLLTESFAMMFCYLLFLYKAIVRFSLISVKNPERQTTRLFFSSHCPLLPCPSKHSAAHSYHQTAHTSWPGPWSASLCVLVDTAPLAWGAHSLLSPWESLLFTGAHTNVSVSVRLPVTRPWLSTLSHISTRCILTAQLCLPPDSESSRMHLYLFPHSIY